MILKRSVISVLFAVAATPALAHVGFHEVGGLAAGFAHPFGGLDHMLAMLSVGVFAALLSGQAVWALPASFIAMMLLGGVLGVTGVEMPAVEAGIAISVVVLGSVIALGWSWPLSAATAMVGAFAVFHGYAHGLEIPTGSGAVGYSVGFALASLVLHLTGLALGTMLPSNGHLGRYSGVAVAVAGLWIALT